MRIMPPVKLYNTYSKKKEIFTPLHDRKVGIYSCGPTVYTFAHIGNLRAYIFSDTLRRVLEYNGYKVTHVMNITDVGHLTSDADTGEDKIEKQAKKKRTSAWELAEYYSRAFLKDLGRLNIEKPHYLPRATQHIKEQIELIKKLESKGYTYRTPEGIYFNTQRFPRYSAFAGQELLQKLPGARIKISRYKKSPFDFALWKFSPKNKKREMEWESPWGKGFPGWHIECSAMSTKYLGQPFDIHTGGIDHIPIHHTNEIAQSEAAEGKKLANFWLHTEFLIVREGKMAKSRGNILTLQDLIDKGFHPLAFRLLCLFTHYRKKLNFSIEALKGARKSLRDIYEFIIKLNFWEQKIQESRANPELQNKLSQARNGFQKAINNDLNTPLALSWLFQLIRENKNILSGKDAAKVKKTIFEFDKVFAILDENTIKEMQKLPPEIQTLEAERTRARKKRDFQKADNLRQRILKKGFVVLDTKRGTLIYKSLI